MKVEKVENTVEMKGEFVTNRFTMEINAKAFDILVNKIYTDKVGAIVRELGANAWDAHVEAKTTDKPFHIHLPNDFEPYFRIRDYGTGLSEEDIKFLYTRVFKSNKTHSNDFIGCMGLGSKTPFCYVDNFAVISYFNGKKYCYLAHKDTEGIPCISEMKDNGSETNEHNGLEITLNVKNEDFTDFSKSVERYYRFYPTRPVISGQELFFDISSIIYQDEKYTILNNESDAFIVMGNVPYSVGSICGKNGIIAKVPIGDADVEASREGLESTAKNKALFNKIADDITVIAEKIKSQSTTNIQPHQKWKLIAEKNKYCSLNHSVFGYQERINTHGLLEYKMYGNKVWYINYCPIIDIKNHISGDILFVEVDDIKENRPSPLQIKWVRDNFGYLVTIFVFNKTITQDIINSFGIEVSDICTLVDIPKAKIKRNPRSSTGPTISGWQVLKMASCLQNSWFSVSIPFDENNDILCCRNNMRIIDSNFKEYIPSDISRLLSYLDVKQRIFSLPKRDFERYCKNNKPKLLFEVIENTLMKKKQELESDESLSKIHTYNQLDSDGQSTYSFLLNNAHWFPNKLKAELNIVDFDDPNHNRIRELDMVQNHMRDFKISLKIPLNSRVLEGIKRYQEKYKILNLVEYEEEFRPDIFKLLGVE